MPSKTWGVSKDTLLAYNGTNLGGGADPHLPVGYWNGYRFRALLQFANDWTGVTKVTSAVLHVRTTSQVHVGFGNDPTIQTRRCTAAWSENSAKSSADGGSGWSGDPTDYAFVSWTDDGAPNASITTAESTWDVIDVTKLVDMWAPASVQKSTGGPGGGAANYGLALLANPEIDTSETTELYGQESTSDPYITLTYESNTAPVVPTLMLPLSGSIVGTTTPALSFLHSDPQGDVCAAWDIEVDATSANGVVPDWASLAYSAYGQTDDLTNPIERVTSALTRGQWYAWRARTKDPAGLWGPWATGWFKVNSLPTATKTLPVASAFAYIYNLDDPSVWTAGGSHARPTFWWAYDDGDGHGQQAYRVRIYAASAGGASVYDSGVTASAATGRSASYALVTGTEYWWTIEVWDTLGESSGESSRTAFKVRWGQAIYEYQPSGGASSSGWTFTAGAVVNGGAAFLYATATGADGAGRSAWTPNIGSLVPAAYLNVLVRLATTTSGSAPLLPDMTFGYIASAIQPDRWTLAPSADWQLDPSTRRFGTQGLRCRFSGAGGRYDTAAPYHKTVGDGVAVQPGVQYTLSGYIRTLGALRSGASARFEVWTTASVWLASTTFVTNTSTAPDGWQRVACTFTTPPGESIVRVVAVYDGGVGYASGDTVWFDGTKMEEGTVATAWTPGFVADATVLDAGGIAIDGQAGGIFRLRGGDGGSRDTVELGAKALVFGGDTPLYSPAAGHLSVGGHLSATDGMAMMVKAGVPSDADFVIDESGNFGLDTTNSRLYVRVGTTWKYVQLT